MCGKPYVANPAGGPRRDPRTRWCASPERGVWGRRDEDKSPPCKRVSHVREESAVRQSNPNIVTEVLWLREVGAQGRRRHLMWALKDEVGLDRPKTED